jgi:hypothetical protein
MSNSRQVGAFPCQWPYLDFVASYLVAILAAAASLRMIAPNQSGPQRQSIRERNVPYVRKSGSSPACLCGPTMLPASSQTRITSRCERLGNFAHPIRVADCVWLPYQTRLRYRSVLEEGSSFSLRPKYNGLCEQRRESDHHFQPKIFPNRFIATSKNCPRRAPGFTVSRMAKRVCYIHIGPHKMGTSSIQWFLNKIERS